MILVDVFARWFLDRVSDVFLKKKDLSVEQRTQMVHRFLLEVPIFCERLGQMIDNALTITHDPSDPKKIEFFRPMIRDLTKDVASLKKRIIKKSFTTERGIGTQSIFQQVRELEFFFEQKEFPRLSKQITDLVWDVIMANRHVEIQLTIFIGYIRGKNKHFITLGRERLPPLKEELEKTSSKSKKIEKTLMQFAKKINE